MSKPLNFFSGFVIYTYKTKTIMEAYNIEDLLFDYKLVEDVALRWRREIGKKYGLETGNRKQIQKAILDKIQELNNNK